MIKRLLIGASIACSLMPGAVLADGTLWSTTVTSSLCMPSNITRADGSTSNLPSSRECQLVRLDHPNISISYSVRATDPQTGAVVAKGATISQGQKIVFEFVPHVYTDIYWFGTGYTNASPYGDWTDGAVANPIQCLAKDEFQSSGNAANTYAELAVDPPVETLAGIGGFSCTQSSPGKYLCTAQQAGTQNVAFQFGDTYGIFYGRAYVQKFATCFGSQSPMNIKGAGSYRLSVPATTIPYPITVITAPPQQAGSAPGAPSVSGGSGSSVSGTSACTTGVPYTITMTATDPQNDRIRYGIDWNGDGTVDQFVPPSGYVPSGTAQTATRTFAIAGMKSIKVFAQDQNGLTSAWTTYAVTCANAQNAATSAAILAGNNNNGAGGASISPALNLRAIPSLVSPGKTSTINWSATSVASCTVSGDNGDSWTGTESPVGGETSAPITKKTIYTLSCRTAAGTTLTANATVNILPTWVEQ